MKGYFDKLDKELIIEMIKMADSAYISVNNTLKDNCLTFGREEFSKIDGSIVVEGLYGLNFDIIFPLNDISRELLIKHFDQ